MVNPVVGNYQLIKKLATGGMAEVWLARQTGIEGFNRHVVVKRILAHLAEDPEFVQMFLNEAKMVSRFNHPNIVQIFDLGETSGQYFIAMEFVHGEDLGRVMRRAWTQGQWAARHIALRIIADACKGLYYAHTRSDEQGRPLNVVHRDISPQNILVSFDGAVKLVDFGIAKASDQASMTKSGALKGKFAYMSPEQAIGQRLDARSDVYALGLVLYELLTGVRPLKRDGEVATLQAAMEGHIEPPSTVVDVPSSFDEVVMKALKKNPDDRYADAREFQRAIEQLLLELRELASSVEVSELMAMLFADRLQEEAQTGSPNPSPQSSSSNSQVPVAAGLPLKPQLDETKSVRASPALTFDDEVSVTRDAPTGSTVPSNDTQVAEGAPVSPSRGYFKKKPTKKRARIEAVHTGVVPKPAPQVEDSASESAVETREDSGSEFSRLVDVRQMKAQQRFRLQTLIAAMLVVGLLGLAFVYSDSLSRTLKGKSQTDDHVPVRVTVTTNPPVTVYIVPPKDDLSRQPEELGRSPIIDRAGAYVGDTVRMINEDRGIFFEQQIEFGQPNQLRQFSIEFVSTSVKVKTKPPLRNAEVFRGNFPLGKTGVNLELFQGSHELTIHSEQLAHPVPFTVNVAQGDKNVLWEVDVTGALKGHSRPD